MNGFLPFWAYNSYMVNYVGEQSMYADDNSNLVYKAGPDGEQYCFPNDADGDAGTYGYREGEQTTPHQGSSTAAFYITDGYTVWRCAGIMYMEVPESNYELEETLDCWLEDDDEIMIVWEDGKVVNRLASDDNDEDD
jgi:hypothetical protein